MAQQSQVRPFGITLLMVFGFISGGMNIAGGIFLILDRNSLDLILRSGNSPSQLLTAGIVALVVGSIQLLLASAIGNANSYVRTFYAVIASFNLAMGLWALVALHSEQRAAGALVVVFSSLILYFLFNSNADKFFDTK